MKRASEQSSYSCRERAPALALHQRGKLGGSRTPTQGESVSEASPRGTYLVIAQSLRTELEGEDPPGVLPSEAALMHAYGVSRTTVRRALKVLASDGLIESEPGVGWRPVGASPRDRRTLVERIADVIVEDSLQVGAAFPSESQLCARFLASRTSVRRALAELEGRGLLVSAHGKGRTVRSLPTSSQSS
ncbi:GntR family transcriptional regulator [Streptomyces sp. NPDC059474]|uniref:GntR family transcriptional regulator n=1 Tax=Streptomyces sp. NPDC059474 TaxID=3346846 RepID=UPI00368F2723